MIGRALYRDADGGMKSVEELSQQGYDENVHSGAFAAGDCVIDGHIPSREILRMNPPIHWCLRCRTQFWIIDGEYVPYPSWRRGRCRYARTAAFSARGEPQAPAAELTTRLRRFLLVFTPAGDPAARRVPRSRVAARPGGDGGRLACTT